MHNSYECRDPRSQMGVPVHFTTSMNSRGIYAVNLPADLDPAVGPSLLALSPLGDTVPVCSPCIGSCGVHVSDAYRHRCKPSESRASRRIGHQSYTKISRGRRIARGCSAHNRNHNSQKRIISGVSAKNPARGTIEAGHLMCSSTCFTKIELTRRM